MRIPSRLTLLTRIATVPSIALAETKASEVWTRATAPGQKVAGVYMKLQSDSDAKLVAAASPAARLVEVHEMAMVDNVMKMRAIPELALPAGRTVELKPGGYHVMLIDIAKPLAAGDRIPVTLTVVEKDGRRSTIPVTAEVRSGAPAQAPHKH
jgi:copper(I)-binding protein